MKIEWKGVPHFRQMVIEAANAGLAGGASVLAQAMKRGFTKTPRGVASQPGQPPSIQRGMLRNSIVSTPGRNLRASAGSNLRETPYGLFLERGAVVKAKRSKYLTVPANTEARRLLEKGSVRSANLKYIPRKGRAPLLVSKDKGKGGPVIVLKKQVRIHPRPWAVPALRRSSGNILQRFKRDAARHLAASVSRAVGGAA